jgi:hypothetical protein
MGTERKWQKIAGDVYTDGLAVGGGSLIKKIASGTVSLDPGNIATVTRGTVTFTLTGARAGDVIVMQPPAALNDDLIFAGAAVTADDTVTVYLYNPTGGGINDGANDWTYTWLDVT